MRYLQDRITIYNKTITNLPEAEFASAVTGDVYLKSSELNESVDEVILPASKIVNSENDVINIMNKHISEAFERISLEIRVHVIIDR
ncbi:hypothetical protein EMN47_17865 [Prolixibacteraceae bacterium JC049]|nr:hypothetical protein [Prolixibacteraceae bacterium JC049]